MSEIEDKVAVAVAAGMVGLDETGKHLATLLPGDAAHFSKMVLDGMNLAWRERYSPGATTPIPYAGVSKAWAVRLCIFDPNGTMAADSEPDLALSDRPPTSIVGIPNVAAWVVENVVAFHDLTAEPVGLDNGTLKTRERSLRVMLSRSGEDHAQWRLNYRLGADNWQAVVLLWRL